MSIELVNVSKAFGETTGWWSAFPRRGTCGLPAVRRWMSRAWRRLSRLWA